MKVGTRNFKRQVKAGIEKITALQQWVDDGILVMNQEERKVSVHYLVWHLWNNRGLIKLCNALYFHMNELLVIDGLPEEKEEFLTIYVDYGDKDNEYGKLGVVKMLLFHPKKGFEQV